MKKMIRIGAIGAAATALLATGLTGPTLAFADTPVPSGPYHYAGHAADGSDATGTWVFTPCGPTCTAGNSEDGGQLRNWEFHLSDGRWTFVGKDTTDCPVGGPWTRDINASFDAVSLAGDWQAVTGPCGPFPAGNVQGPWTFELTQ